MSGTDPKPQPEPESDPLVGIVLGGYQVGKLIASGGMGLVYEARHELIGRRVAVKVLRPEVASGAGWSDRFLAEARALSAIKHKNIVEIVNFGLTPDGRQYMMTEFLEGEALDAVIAREAPLEPHRALTLVDEVLSGLSAAHKAGVIHRDLKPSNVFLLTQSNGERSVKVLDFGLSRQDPVVLAGSAAEPADRSNQKTSLLAGTPAYVAPEQALGRRVEAAADLYCTGVMLFELLTGRLPFVADTIPELVRKHVNEPAPRVSEFVSGLSPALDDFVAQLLEKQPAKRLESAELARRTLQRLMRDLRESATQQRPNPLMDVATQPTAESLSPVSPALAPVVPPTTTPTDLPDPREAITSRLPKSSLEERILPRRSRGLLIGAVAGAAFIVGGVIVASRSAATQPEAASKSSIPLAAVTEVPLPPPSAPAAAPVDAAADSDLVGSLSPRPSKPAEETKRLGPNSGPTAAKVPQATKRPAAKSASADRQEVGALGAQVDAAKPVQEDAAACVPDERWRRGQFDAIAEVEKKRKAAFAELADPVAALQHLRGLVTELNAAVAAAQTGEQCAGAKRAISRFARGE